ncbi:MAG: leucine--tRNA ligase, partial [Methanosarcinales archaeon]|nr:leucine--tRNA ligase [Methanosarcinales archaeon]
QTQADAEEIIRVTRSTPSRIVLYTAPEWKRTMLSLALEISRGKTLDMGLLMKAAMADPEIQRHKKEAPKYAGKLAKSVHVLAEEALVLDEFETLSRETEYLSRAFGCPVEVRSADEAGDDPKGKSKQAEPGRPAIYIE